MNGFQVNAADYRKAAAALKDADKTIRLEYSRTIRAIAKPLGQTVLAAGADKLPKRGGLSDRVKGATVSVSATQTRAVVSLKTAEGYDLRAMNRGRLRHPTYGHKPWVQQDIEANVFSEAFEERAPAARAAMLAAGNQALSKIAREGS